MGQEILYCAKCARRLTSGDFEKGLGIRVGVKISCTDCLQDLVASLSPQEQREFAKEVAQLKTAKSEAKRSSSGPIPTIKSPRPATSAARPNAGPLLALAGIGGVLLLVVVLFLSSGTEKRPPVAVPPPVQPPQESASTRAAREAVERARKSSPGDLEAQIAAWAQAVSATQGSPYQKEATEMHQGLVAMRKSAHVKESLELDGQSASMLAREEFVAAGELYERARRRHDTSEWGTLIDAKLQAIRTREDSLFASLLPKVMEAHRKGQEDEVKAIRDRVARWQRSDLTVELEKTLAAAVPAVAPPAPPPAAPGERPWKPIFDGKSMDFMSKSSRDGWEIRDGALYMNKPNSVQTREAFGDGEFRFRFETREIEAVYFGVRKSAQGYHRVIWEKGKALEGKICEVVFTCRGESITAQLNGEPLRVLTVGNPTTGNLMFNGKAKYFRVLSIEYRDLP